jgi:thioredoxin 1
MVELTEDSQWQELVLGSDIPVVVDFYATWCGPCKILYPIYEKKQQENNNFKLIKVDVDEHVDLSEEQGAFGVPHTMLFVKGQKVYEFPGILSENIDELFKKISEFYNN